MSTWMSTLDELNGSVCHGTRLVSLGIAWSVLVWQVYFPFRERHGAAGFASHRGAGPDVPN